jgi:hypothetical protein
MLMYCNLKIRLQSTMSSGGKRKRSHKASAAAAAADDDEKRSKQSKVKGKSAADGQVAVCGSLRLEIRFLPSVSRIPHSFVSQQAMDEREDHDQQQDKATVVPSAFAYDRVVFSAGLR